MSGAVLSPVTALQQGYRWWTAELAGLLPDTVRARHRATEPDIVVSVETQGLRILDTRSRRDARVQMGRTLAKADAWDVLLAIARERPAALVRLRLANAAVFTRRVELPEAARADIAQILDLDLERATPFRAKDVYTAHLVVPNGTRHGPLKVHQLIAERASIDGPLSDVRATGVTVSGVDCWNEDGSAALPVDFLARDAAGSETAPRSNRFTALLAVLIAGLAASAVYLTVTQHETALANLQQDVAQTRTRADAVHSVLAASQDRLKDALSLQNLKDQRVPAVVTLDRLTKIMPDWSWLTDLGIEGDTVAFSGYAKTAAALIPLLENSDFFSDAAFTAPVTRDEQDNKERFSLRARIRLNIAADGPASPAASPQSPAASPQSPAASPQSPAASPAPSPEGPAP